MRDDQAIYERIYQAIVEQRLPPGTKLGEEALCEAFGITRPRVRKVLLRLAHDHLVTLQPNRGAFVAQPSIKEAREVFAVRRYLEPPMVAALTARITPAQVGELRDFVARERAVQARSDRQRAIRLSGEFHLRLADMAGNDVLANTLRQLVSRTSLIIAMYEIPGASGCNSAHHGVLVDFIDARDAAAAAAYVAEHLHAIEQSLHLESRAPKPVELARIFARAGDPDLAAAS